MFTVEQVKNLQVKIEELKKERANLEGQKNILLKQVENNMMILKEKYGVNTIEEVESLLRKKLEEAEKLYSEAENILSNIS